MNADFQASGGVSVMQTDISRRHVLEQDAKRLEDTASFIRKMADEDWTKMKDWERHEKERELRTRIKYSIETLLHNMPC